MRLVFVTQTVDVEDPVLGATVAKIRALAERCEALHVLSLREVGRHALPANVTFATFGAPTRLRRGVSYLRALAPVLLRHPPDGLIAHMCPIYLVLAAPIAKPARVRLVLWYTHWKVDRTLRAATALCDVALSVDRDSYPLASPKVRGIGHGIDLADFTAREGLPPADGRLALLGLGRTSPSKGFVTVLEALELAAEAGLDFELELRGPSTTDEERRHREELAARVESEALLGRARLAPPIPRSEIPTLLRGVDAVVSPHEGGLDKVVYESAASGVPVLACNPAFEALLDGLPVELRFRGGDARDLAEKLLAFAAASPDARAEAGRELRRRVEAGHSAETWADAVIRAVEELG